MLTNCIYLVFHRRIPSLGERRLICCFVWLWIDPVLVIVGDRSCSVDGNHIFKFLIFESQLCRLGQFASEVLVTTFGRRLPCNSKWHLKASQFSWLLLWLQRIWRWIVVQWLLSWTFSWLLLDWLWCFRLLGECRFYDDISVEVLVQDCFVCSIRYCVPLSFSEYHISGAVKRLGEWIVYGVLVSRYALPNEYADSGFVMQHLSFLIRNVDRSQATEHTEMFKMASSHARPHMESCRLLIVSECGSWDRPPLRLQSPSTSSKVRHGPACIIRVSCSCGSPVWRLQKTEVNRA